MDQNLVISGANKYIDPSNCYVLVVGNKDIVSTLERFDSNGEVDFYDINGDPVEMSQKTIPASLTADKVIEEDNSACIAQAKGGLRFIRKAKHYQIALRYIQKLHVDGEVDFNYCETNEQIADLFTKALNEPKFTYFRDKIMHLSA